MIEVQGNYVLSFKIGDNKDFIKEPDFIKFVLERTAGSSLPNFILNFTTENLNVLSLLKENTLEVFYGKDHKNIKPVLLRIVGDPFITKKGNSAYIISVSGFLDVPNYFGTQAIITTKLSGVTAVQNKLKALGLRMETNNLASSEDSQSWIQFQESTRRYITRLLFHSWLEKGFPIWSFTSSKTFRVYNYLDLIKSEVKYRFTQKITTKKDILILSNYALLADDNNAFINFYQGYDSSLPMENLITGEHTNYSSTIKALLSKAKELNRSTKEALRMDSLVYMNDHLHAKYHQAKYKNLKSLLTYSKTRIGLKLLNTFIDIEPLDYVYLEIPSNDNASLSDKYLSGNYVVVKAVDSFQNRQQSHYIEIARDGINAY